MKTLCQIPEPAPAKPEDVSDKFYRKIAMIRCFIFDHRFTRIDWGVFYQGDVTHICEICGRRKSE